MADRGMSRANADNKYRLCTNYYERSIDLFRRSFRADATF